MPANIKVAVRIRPLLAGELSNGERRDKVEINQEKRIIEVADDHSGQRKCYKFDHIFEEDTSQKQVYEDLGLNELISKVVDGYHGTVFAYGQTGAGKTYTMEGSRETDGLTQQAIRQVFNEIERCKKSGSGRHFTVFCSFMQIYNERVYDLLNMQKATTNPANCLRIRWNKRDQFTVEDLFVFECKDVGEVLELFRLGIRNKVIASHNLNAQSSRSHAIFAMTIQSVDPFNLSNVVLSKLQLVDLAGSERAQYAGLRTAQHQKESADINKSLFTLRKVINGLVDMRMGKRDTHIPYRDSKLTCLLKQSLGGNCFAVMVACLSPSDRFIDQNISTLNYATKASYIANDPIRNDDPNARKILELKNKNHLLRYELKAANEFILGLCKEIGRGPKFFGLQYIDEGLLTEEVLEAKRSQERQSSSFMADDTTGFKSTGSANGGKPGKDLSNVTISRQSPARQDENQKYDDGSHTANIVTKILQSNRILRNTIEGLYTKIENTENENSNLQVENRDLRDKVEAMEQVLNCVPEEFERMRQLPEYKEMSQGTRSLMVEDIIALRQSNKKMEKRVRTLEDQNSEFMKNLHYVGNNEPTRPNFSRDRGSSVDPKTAQNHIIAQYNQQQMGQTLNQQGSYKKKRPPPKKKEFFETKECFDFSGRTASGTDAQTDYILQKQIAKAKSGRGASLVGQYRLSNDSGHAQPSMPSFPALMNDRSAPQLPAHFKKMQAYEMEELRKRMGREQQFYQR